MEIKELQIVFSDKLKDLMSEFGIKKISDLAKRINIPRTTISNWINLVRTPQIDSLVTLADFFKVSVDYLLGRTDI